MGIWNVAVARCDACGEDEHDYNTGYYGDADELALMLMADGWEVDYDAGCSEWVALCPECSKKIRLEALEKCCKLIPK